VAATLGTGPYLASQTALDAGLDLNLFGSAQLQSVTSSSSGTVAGNAVVTLDGALFASLNVGSGASNGAIFEVNSSVTVTNWNNNAGSARVDNNGGAIVVGTLTVGGTAFAVFQSSATAAVTLPNIDFAARANFAAASTLHVAGGIAHIGVNGATSVAATTKGAITGAGTVKLSGGVSVDGNIPKDVTLHVAASGRSAPLAVVDSSTTLTTAGNVEGDGTIVVNGNFELTAAAKVDPKVVINAAANFVINTGVAFQAKAVNVSERAVLVIGATANKGQVTINKIAQCLGTVRINLATTAAAYISSQAAGGQVAIKYDSNNVPADLAKCTVEIVDSEKKTYTLTSRTSASAGRRLLASSGTATWGSDSMTYSMSQQNSAAYSFALLPLVIIGVVGIVM
jgi:hypothetical protein